MDASVSADGRYVAFLSTATNIVKPFRTIPQIVDSQVYVRDMQLGKSTWLNSQSDLNGGRYASNPAISTNGDYLAFISADLFTGPEALQPSTYLRVVPLNSFYIDYPIPSELAGARVHNIRDFAMTPDGRRIVALASYTFSVGPGASVLEIYDNVAHTNGLIAVSTNITRPRGFFASPRISPDGTTIFFTSSSLDLPGSDGTTMQLYRHSLTTGQTLLLGANSAAAKSEVLEPSIDANGSVVAFLRSGASVPDEENDRTTAYLLRTDRSEVATKVQILDPRGARASGNGASTLPVGILVSRMPARALSIDGHIAVFASEANDLVPGDTNSTTDIFVRNLQTKETRAVNILPGTSQLVPGAVFIGMSADGRRIAWHAPVKVPNNSYVGTIFIYDTQSGINVPGSVLPDGTVSTGTSSYAQLSENGRYLVFYLNGPASLHLRDLQEERDTFLLQPVFASFRALSPTGKYILFYSYYSPYEANGVTRILDWANNRTNLFSGVPVGMSSDDSALLFLRYTGELSLYNPALTTSNLVATNVVIAALSADGSTVAYGEAAASPSTAISKLLIYDARTGTRSPVPLGANAEPVHLAAPPSLSSDGRFIAFTARTVDSLNTNSAFSSVYVYDHALAQLTLVSSNTNGQPANATFSEPSISGDGQTIVFESLASDLVTNDWNLASDVFVANLGQGLRAAREQNTIRISWKTANAAKLQEASSVVGPWTTLENAPEPYLESIAPGGVPKFFRVIY